MTHKAKIFISLVVCLVIVGVLLATKWHTSLEEYDNINGLKKHYEITQFIPDTFSYSNLQKNLKAPSASSGDKQNENIILQRQLFNASELSSFPIGPDNKSNKDKYFIYRCDEATMSFCGGWADRIRGVFVSYLIANLTGRTFKMEMLFKGCDIHRFIVPNQVDWYHPTPIHNVVRTGNGIAQMNMIDDNTFIRNVETDFMVMPSMKSRYIYFKGNRESTKKFQALSKYKKQLAWMKDLTYAEMNNALFRHLFKPSPYLQQKAKSFLAKNLSPNERLVCAHVRVGHNPTMPTDTDKRIKDSHLPNVWKFLQEQTKQNDSKIFFMTDSENLIAKIKDQSFKDKLFFSPGKLVHIDRTPGASAKVKCDGLEKVIFEQFVLMHCDVLIVAISGISRTAAYVRDTDSGLFCFLRSGVVVPCKRSEIREIYKIKV